MPAICCIGFFQPNRAFFDISDISVTDVFRPERHVRANSTTRGEKLELILGLLLSPWRRRSFRFATILFVCGFTIPWARTKL